MKNAKCHSVFIFLGILALGFSINYAQADYKRVPKKNGTASHLEKLAQAISPDKKKKKSVKNGLFKNISIQTRRIIQSVDSKKACYFLLASSAVVSVAYAMHQYWPLIKVFWNEKWVDTDYSGVCKDINQPNTVKDRIFQVFKDDVHPRIVALEHRIHETMQDPELPDRVRVKCEKIEEWVKSFCVQAWVIAEPGIQAALEYGKKLYIDYAHSPQKSS